MSVKKPEPTPYHHKAPMRFQDFEIYYNKDTVLTHIVENKHDYYEFYFLISGSVTYDIDDVSYQLKSGDVILLAPNQVHKALINTQDGSPYERFVLWLSPSYLERLSSQKTDLLLPFQNTYITKSHLSLAPDMKLIIHTLLNHLYTCSLSQEYGADLMINSYIIELLVHIARIKLFQKDFYFEKHFVSNDKNSKLLIDILSYIDEHIYEELRIEEITLKFFISRSHLAKLFTKEIGLPIHQFIIKKKLFLARQDLLSGMSVNDICSKYNFGNYSSFFRAFKLEFGQSPSKLKRQNNA